MSERYQGLRFERKRPKWLVPVIFVSIIIVIIGFLLYINHTYDDYLKLDYVDKLVLEEYEKLYTNSNGNKELEDLDIKSKTVVFISEDNFKVYVMNSKNAKNDLFTQKVNVPESRNVNVYKISILNPSVIKILLSSKVPEAGTTYKLNGEDVFYYRYSRDKNIDELNSANHLSIELVHNMYNYYKQNDWQPVLDVSSGMITNEIYNAYNTELVELGNIQNELRQNEPNKQKLGEYAYQYVRAVEKMKEIDPDYTNKVLYRETYNGVPRYYSIQGAKTVGYSFDIMYYNNEQNVSFSNVITSINAGGVSKSFLYERGSYEIGALLCKLLDTLEVDYRSKVDANNKDNKITLYDILVEYLDVPEDL